MITTSFQVQLEASGKWDCWVVELGSNLKIIVGAQGIPLYYVIRENNIPDQIEHNTWEEKAVLAVPLTRILYNQDNLTVNNIILRNIADASDAFTYVKPYIKKDDGRTDIKALRSRYENVAMQEQYVSDAKRTIETIQYRNKISRTFEKFVRNLVKAVDELEKRGRGMHSADIVEIIWQRARNAELSQYLTALKVQFQHQPLYYREALQDIASQVPSIGVDTFRKASEVSVQVTGPGRAPDQGVYDSNRLLFYGTYPEKEWFSDSVKPHREDIRRARDVANFNINSSITRHKGRPDRK